MKCNIFASPRDHTDWASQTGGALTKVGPSVWTDQGLYKAVEASNTIFDLGVCSTCFFNWHFHRYTFDSSPSSKVQCMTTSFWSPIPLKLEKIKSSPGEISILLPSMSLKTLPHTVEVAQ